MKESEWLLSESPLSARLSLCLSLSFPPPPHSPREAPRRLLHPSVSSPGSVLQEAAITEDTCYMLPGNKMLPEKYNPPLTLHRTGTSR